MSASTEIGNLTDVSNAASGLRQHTAGARGTEVGLMRQTTLKLPETSSVAFAHINGISDKLQSIATRIARDDAVRTA